MISKLSVEFKDLTKWLMDVTKNEMSFQADYDYDIYDAHTGWKIALFKSGNDVFKGGVFFQLFDEQYQIGTQVEYTIQNDNFLISTLAYWDAEHGQWQEDYDPYEMTQKVWNLLKNR